MFVGTNDSLCESGEFPQKRILLRKNCSVGTPKKRKDGEGFSLLHLFRAVLKSDILRKDLGWRAKRWSFPEPIESRSR
ncbi:hypothetical protein DLM75_07575 [Leptospira stimsonii]|uniref:Uncharacterized protein n=1 Tax=Leptospira stimsonii TaxID=2202203 RepID=A0A396ZBL3_9LEPT|nr:hypothetical protein DLM75_07575 [Leptospira stimsonii]